jgi:hypothetical protein
MDTVDSHPAALQLIPQARLRPGIQGNYLIVLRMFEIDPNRRVLEIVAIDYIR